MERGRGVQDRRGEEERQEKMEEGGYKKLGLTVSVRQLSVRREVNSTLV